MTFAVSNTASNTLLTIIGPSFAIVLGLIGWIAKTLLQVSAIQNEQGRRIDRVENELWPLPAGAMVEYSRHVVAHPDPAAATQQDSPRLS